MVIKTKRIPIKDEIAGRNWVEKIRKSSGDDIANKLKLINETSFNVPVYDLGFPANDVVAFYIPESSDWYLEFPEEITVNVNT